MSAHMALLKTNVICRIIKRYAGHSKWANIRHIKGAKDAERANLFTKISRQIKVAVQGKQIFNCTISFLTNLYNWALTTMMYMKNTL